MNNCDPTEQQAVQDRLEQLYLADGRHDPAHPMHALYTGLAQAAQQQQQEPLSSAAQAVLDAVTAQLDWDARYHSHSAAAAALRAAALYCPVDRRVLMTIADELDSLDS